MVRVAGSITEAVNLMVGRWANGIIMGGRKVSKEFIGVLRSS